MPEIFKNAIIAGHITIIAGHIAINAGHIAIIAGHIEFACEDNSGGGGTT